jgi:putative membrane protein
MTWRHRGALGAGLVLLSAAFIPALSALLDARLSLHMALEMALLAIVVPMLAYGSGPLLADRLRWQLHPIAGIIALNVVVFAAQLPAAVDGEAQNGLLRELGLLAFVAGAFLFWVPIVGKSRLSAIGKIGTLMVASVPPTIPGLTMALSHHLFYAGYRSIEDQQVAGLLLFGTAKLALVGGTFVVLWRMLTPETEPDDRDDRDQPVDDTPPIAPAWLAQLDGELPSEAGRPRQPVASTR